MRVSGNRGITDSHNARPRREDEVATHTGRPHGFSLGVSRQRQAVAALVSLFALPLLTLALTHERDRVSLGSDLLLYLVVVVLIAAIGGAWVASAAAVAAFLLVNWY